MNTRRADARNPCGLAPHPAAATKKARSRRLVRRSDPYRPIPPVHGNRTATRRRHPISQTLLRRVPSRLAIHIALRRDGDPTSACGLRGSTFGGLLGVQVTRAAGPCSATRARLPILPPGSCRDRRKRVRTGADRPRSSKRAGQPGVVGARIVSAGIPATTATCTSGCHRRCAVASRTAMPGSRCHRSRR